MIFTERLWAPERLFNSEYHLYGSSCESRKSKTSVQGPSLYLLAITSHRFEAIANYNFSYLQPSGARFVDLGRLYSVYLSM